MGHDECIFCKIAIGQVLSEQVYADSDLIVFKDIRPVAPLHLLVVPRRHIPTLQHCESEDQELLGKMMLLAPKLAREFGYAYEPGSDKEANGFRVVMNTGPGGGQELYHIHMHVIAGLRPSICM
ncbi:histidine triad nucleotide-binding protein [Candidatus Pandoraea novymonadis]|uniref:Purine nucleoside phosphoramidase n=1 Tax=Candidatus Pandoraea novymonadis TaxID=1808959 RepID=A0ABX5FCX0_9BURK|nr:histidine triad nucleotide-binding protein [Candidatus Pandoraea novymonadis]PSB91586.1 Purine nucleoside phosphoramidase [Candidatus Pandoraea novymonadis]